MRKRKIKNMKRKEKKISKPHKKVKIRKGEYSVTQYAALRKVTRQGVLMAIGRGALPDGVSVRKVGATWVVNVK